MSFKDHFSAQADAYARYRPQYPDEMFAWLAATTPTRRLAWDSATGNGQAASGLRAHFDAVVGTDASPRQIGRAAAAAGVGYCVCRSEAAALADGVADLTFVGQAAHWFDLPAFYEEVRRVSRTGALLAVCGYGLLRVEPALDAIVSGFYRDTVGAYWPPERRMIERGYRDLPFPFETIATPRFRMRRRWRLEELLGYLGSWSAVSRYRAARGSDPLPALGHALKDLWGAPMTVREVEWPLYLLVGRVAVRRRDGREG